MILSFRVPAAIVAIVVALAVVAAVAETGSATSPSIQGDANCDGLVGAGDALSILSDEAGLTGAASDCVQARGDTDCSGETDTADVIAILLYVIENSALSAAGECVAIGGQLPSPTVIAETATPTPTPTPTATASPTLTPTPTSTASLSSTPTPTATASLSPTPTPTTTPDSGCNPPPTAIPAGGPPATPGTLDYRMMRLPAAADVQKLTNVVPIPGDPGLAIITTEEGIVWTVCLYDARPREEMLNLTPFVRDNLPTGQHSDEGLVSLVFDPIDPSVVYINYTMPPDGTYMEEGATPGPDTIRSRIGRFRIVGGRISRNSQDVVIDIFQTSHIHGADGLVFGPEGMLYIGSGDGGYKRTNGQTLDDLWGAVLRIDVHSGQPYAIPADNPFFDGPGGNADELWAYGFRNPWRFTFDDGKIWLTDVGALTWEEVNIVEKGGNYGWPVMEGHGCLSLPGGQPPTPVASCNTTGYATPRAVYNHDNGCAIIGGQVYHGAQMPELEGYFIYGDLCTGQIWGLDTNEDQSDPILLADEDVFPVSWATTNDGEIIMVNHSSSLFPGDGGIYQLQRQP